MTSEEAKIKIINYCNQELQRFNKFSLFGKFKKTINIDFTKILDPWQLDANLSLPEEITFKIDNQILINSQGLTINESLIKWDSIPTTAIAEHRIYEKYNRSNLETRFYLMFIDDEDKLRNLEITYPPKYSNLLGHFIELYKKPI